MDRNKDEDAKNATREEIIEALPYAVLLGLMWLLAFCLGSYAFAIGAIPVY